MQLPFASSCDLQPPDKVNLTEPLWQKVTDQPSLDNYYTISDGMACPFARALQSSICSGNSGGSATETQSKSKRGLMLISHQDFTEEVQNISAEDVAASGRVIRAVECLIRSERQQAAPVPTEADLLKLAQRIKMLRSIRIEFLFGDGLGEPGWDMLLALYIARGEGYRLTISNLCNESGVPPTTALRWVERLVETGQALKTAHPTDARCTFVEGHPDTLAKMRAFLERAWTKHVSAR